MTKTRDLWSRVGFWWQLMSRPTESAYSCPAAGGTGETEDSEAFYRRIAEIQEASPGATEVTARCSGGGTTWTEDHHFNTIADAVQFAWSDEPHQRGIVTIDGKEWYI